MGPRTDLNKAEKNLDPTRTQTATILQVRERHLLCWFSIGPLTQMETCPFSETLNFLVI
jgi:hypothetical protein